MIEKNLQNPTKKKKIVPTVLASAAAATLIFTAGLNTSPAMAKNLSEIPVFGSVVKVLTFTTYEVDEDNFAANIEVPQVSGNSAEIAALNEKFAAEGKSLYEQFKEEIAGMEAGHLGVDSGYIVETDTDDILSFTRYVEITMASGTAEMTYITIDKKAETVITLPSLFKDESYIDSISKYLENEMRERMIATEGDEMYWVDGTEYYDNSLGSFETIAEDQSFFINENGKLVIVFDEYEVAPGYMGVVKFEIPSEVIQASLVSNQYIK